MFNADQRQKLGVLIQNMATYYGRKFDRPVISMMIDDLQDLPFVQVEMGYNAYRKNAKNTFFPLPAAIRQLILPEPTEDMQAREIASRISQAVTKFGHPNELEAQEFVGEVGWRVVQRKGGWNYICQNLGVTLDATVFEAQTRELAKVEILTQKNPAFGKLLEEATKKGLMLDRGEPDGT